jgi:hypothetical protein
MLAANLRVNFKVDGRALRPSDIDSSKLNKEVKTICPLLFSREPLGTANNTVLKDCVNGSGDDGNTVTEETDWLRRL